MFQLGKKKEVKKKKTLEQSMARFYMYIRSDEKIFTLDSIFHISSQATKPGGLYFGFTNSRVNSKMIRVQNCSGVASSTVNVA